MRPPVRHLVWSTFALLAASAATPAMAQTIDGLYAGALECGPSGSSPGFTQMMSLVLRNAAGGWSGGKPGQNGYHISTVTVATDGSARVEGYYLVGTDKRLTSLAGRVEARSLVATGRRGPRDCRLSLNRPPASGARAPYRLPYDVTTIRARSQKLSPRACAESEGAPRDLVIEGFYRLDDPTHSQIDPQRLAAYNAALKPLRSFEAAVSATADLALRTPSTDIVPSVCVISLLDHSASADALLGNVSSQGAYERKWSAIAFALAFMESKPATDLNQAGRISRWLNGIGDAVAIYYMQAPSGAISDRSNNHAYWAALSSVVTGMAAQDGDLFDWGMARFLASLNDIDANGYLALELARGSKALHYHRFSLEPLLLLALIARANEVAIPAEAEAALKRLIQRVRLGLDDARPFAERTGRSQDDAGKSRADWAWAELALALFNDSDLAARVAPLRPLSSRWLGGDLTLRYVSQ